MSKNISINIITITSNNFSNKELTSINFERYTIKSSIFRTVKLIKHLSALL